MQYGASSILAYIVAARDKREAHAEDIWLSVQPQAGQHYNEQGITLDARIEETIATLIEVVVVDHHWTFYAVPARSRLARSRATRSADPPLE